jgi:hypothetical protein
MPVKENAIPRDKAAAQRRSDETANGRNGVRRVGRDRVPTIRGSLALLSVANGKRSLAVYRLRLAVGRVAGSPIRRFAVSPFPRFALSPLTAFPALITLCHGTQRQRTASVSDPAFLLDDGECCSLEMSYLRPETDFYSLVQSQESSRLVHALGRLPGVRLSVRTRAGLFLALYFCDQLRWRRIDRAGPLFDLRFLDQISDLVDISPGDYSDPDFQPLVCPPLESAVYRVRSFLRSAS